MKSLARGTVAVFCCQWFIAAELIFDLAAVATSFPFDVEVLRLVVNPIWFSMFPLIFFPVRAIASLVLVSLLLATHYALISALGPRGRRAP